MKTRFIKDTFRSDGRVETLDPNEKLLFLYLITNANYELCGVYELPIKRIAYETGLDRSDVEQILLKFEKKGKIIYRHGRVRIVNAQKHQNSRNIKIKQGIERGMQSIPSELMTHLGLIDDSSMTHCTYTYTYRDNLEESNLDLEESNSYLTEQPNGEADESLASPEQASSVPAPIPPTPLSPKKRSIVNKHNKVEAIAVYDTIKQYAEIVDGTLEDCVVLASRLKKIGPDPIVVLGDIIQAMIASGQDQFYSIASPRRLADNLGTIYTKLKSHFTKNRPKEKVVRL